MQTLLVCGDGHLLLIDSILDVNGSLILLAVVRSGIYRLLDSEKVSASILCHHEIVVNDMRGKFRDHFDYLRKKKIHDLSGAGYICMSIIYLSVRMLRVCTLLHPHVVFARRLVAKADEPLLCNRIGINQRQAIFLRDLSHSCRIVTMTISLEVALVVEPAT